MELNVRFSIHRAETGELNEPGNRQRVLRYRETHGLWAVLKRLLISQETYWVMEKGLLTVRPSAKEEDNDEHHD